MKKQYDLFNIPNSYKVLEPTDLVNGKGWRATHYCDTSEEANEKRKEIIANGGRAVTMWNPTGEIKWKNTQT